MSGRVVGVFSGESSDFFPQPGKAIAAVRREVLGNADGAEKGGIVLEDFARLVAAVEIGEDDRDAADDVRIGIDLEVAFSIAELRNEPKV